MPVRAWLAAVALLLLAIAAFALYETYYVPAHRCGFGKPCTQLPRLLTPF
jgi:hypothetical protein